MPTYRYQIDIPQLSIGLAQRFIILPSGILLVDHFQSNPWFIAASCNVSGFCDQWCLRIGLETSRFSILPFFPPPLRCLKVGLDPSPTGDVDCATAAPAAIVGVFLWLSILDRPCQNPDHVTQSLYFVDCLQDCSVFFGLGSNQSIFLQCSSYCQAIFLSYEPDT